MTWFEFEAEAVGDDVLDLARVLRRGVDEHVAVLAGNCERHLAFKVEVFLAPHPELAGDLLRRAGNLLGRVAANEAVIGVDPGLGDDRVVDVDHRHRRRRRDPGELHRGAGLVAGSGKHHEEHLAVEHDAFPGDCRIVLDLFRADIVGAGDVLRRQHVDDAGRLLHGLEVDAGGAPGGDRRVARRRVHCAHRLADIVDIDRLAGHVLGGAVMRARLADDRERLRAGDDVGKVHGQATSRCPTIRVRFEAVPAASISALPRSACAVSVR